MGVMKNLEVTCIHIIASEINFYSSTEKIHIALHLSIYLVEINLNSMLSMTNNYSHAELFMKMLRFLILLRV